MIISKEVLADLIIERLNEISKRDPVAFGKLIEARIECNEALADHPSVQVSNHEPGLAKVGVLGIINGLIGTIDNGPRKGWGLVTVACEDDGSVVRFQRTNES
jgi:hypothetical protein